MVVSVGTVTFSEVLMGTVTFSDIQITRMIGYCTMLPQFLIFVQEF
jgi:hypothetical protein